jgi:hypothetical protein
MPLPSEARDLTREVTGRPVLGRPLRWSAIQRQTGRLVCGFAYQPPCLSLPDIKLKSCFEIHTTRKRGNLNLVSGICTQENRLICVPFLSCDL